MSLESIEEKRKKVVLLEEEIELLKEKKEKLKKLKLDYYYDYFTTERKDFSLLTDIPHNPIMSKHLLRDSSALNVDTIGKIICALFKKYENKDYKCERLYRIEIDGVFHERTDYPILVIGEPYLISEKDNCEENIVIDYDINNSTEEFPTKNPIYWDTLSLSTPKKISNYSYLVGYLDDLSFDCNYEFVKELIYSLAYYQKENDFKMMSPSDTWKVYRKIYKNRW